MFYRVLNTLLLWGFVIFIIKPNSIYANNTPNLQIFYKNSEEASERKTLPTAVKRHHFDLVQFLDLPLLNYSHNIAREKGTVED